MESTVLKTFKLPNRIKLTKMSRVELLKVIETIRKQLVGLETIVSEQAATIQKLRDQLLRFSYNQIPSCIAFFRKMLAVANLQCFL
jgi:hypothetical protein